jgi:transforming growth factor-beta-induced protein
MLKVMMIVGAVGAAVAVSATFAMMQGAQPMGKASEKSQAAAPARDIVDTAVAAGSFKTLAAALQAAGLVEALKGPGPFTVFAPTDEAFAKLPAGTVEELLKPENKKKLIAVLTYHVVSGKATADKVTTMKSAGSLNGQRIPLEVRGGKVMAGRANVVQADIAASNGVIHVIDAVILPEFRDAVEVAGAAGSFGTLLAAAQAAGLVDALKSDGDGRGLTIFAPTDEAFAKLPPGTVESLLKPENRETLAQVLKYHVVAGRAYSDKVVGMHKTLAGPSVTVKAQGGKVMVGSATVAAADIESSNAVIHVIDAVILPPEK